VELLRSGQRAWIRSDARVVYRTLQGSGVGRPRTAPFRSTP
jgi:hypothetical protein